MNTLKIKSTHAKTQGNYVIINESDFDPKKHELLGSEEKKETAKDKKARLALIATNAPKDEQNNTSENV